MDGGRRSRILIPSVILSLSKDQFPPRSQVATWERLLFLAKFHFALIKIRCYAEPMNLRRWLVVLSFWALILSIQNASAAPTIDDPATVTKALYQSVLHDMGFTPDTVKASRPWLTPDLYSRLWKKVNQPVPKGDAPDIEGDVFLDCQDPPDKFEVGHATIDQANAKVDVTLFWPKEKRHYIVLLKQLSGAWKVCDVNYGSDGTLTALLK